MESMRKLFKGLIFIIGVFICFTILNKVEAANAYFVWEKTVIDVPLNYSLEEYKDDYIIKLYVDGNESNDFYVTYETNCSTFSTVLTTKVGRYTVYYKAYSKNNYISSEQAIVFNVVDINAPVIKLHSDPVEVEIGKTLENYYWFDVTDDSDENNIKFKLNDQNVIYNALGTYEASVSATDIYENIETVYFTVKVVDKTPPSIFVLKPLVFEYLEDVDISEYLSCQDNCDGDISKLISVSDIDTKTLGKKNITVEVTDYSNNKTVMTFEVIVKDDKQPNIDLLFNEVTLDIKDYEQYNSDYFKQYVFSIRDNYTKSEDIELKIDTANLSKTVSDFTVYYSAVDENNNKTTKELTVKMREFVGPEIIGPSTVEIAIGEDVDLLSLVDVYDEFDINARQRLEIDSAGFNNVVEGIYYVKYICFNTSGIYTEKTISIRVYNPQQGNETNLIIGIVCGGVIFVSAGIGVVIYYKRKKK